MAATDLYIVLISDSLESGPVLHQVGQVDVHGGAQGCSQVGRTRSDVAHVRVVEEPGTFFDGCGGTRQTLEDLTDIGTGLHRNDAELVLLVHPDEERLRIVMENTTTFWPVAVQTTGLEEAVAFLKQEVIVNELLLCLLIHAIKRVESSLEVTCEATAGFYDSLHDVVALTVGDSWSQWEASNVASDSDPRRLDQGSLFLSESWAVQLIGVHVRDVLVGGSVTVVVLNDAIKEVLERDVRVFRTSIDTDA